MNITNSLPESSDLVTCTKICSSTTQHNATWHHTKHDTAHCTAQSGTDTDTRRNAKKATETQRQTSGDRVRHGETDEDVETCVCVPLVCISASADNNYCDYISLLFLLLIL